MLSLTSNMNCQTKKVKVDIGIALYESVYSSSRTQSSSGVSLTFCGKEVLASPLLREWLVAKKITLKDLSIKIFRKLRSYYLLWDGGPEKEPRVDLWRKHNRHAGVSDFLPWDRCCIFLHTSWSPFLQCGSLLSISLSSIPCSFFQTEVPLCALRAKPLLTQSSEAGIYTIS